MKHPMNHPIDIHNCHLSKTIFDVIRNSLRIHVNIISDIDLLLPAKNILPICDATPVLTRCWQVSGSRSKNEILPNSGLMLALILIHKTQSVVRLSSLGSTPLSVKNPKINLDI
jgi:hypothetical protein